VWGPGDGAGLEARQTRVGRVGGLICWEHWMPLARQALHDSGEDIHVAQWPTVNDAHQLASRHYAFEGRCFVLAAGSLLHVDALGELGDDLVDVPEDGLLLRGGSAIYGPDGATLAEPVFDREAVVVADLDFEAIARNSMTLDVAGHYHRPDVFRLEVQRTRQGRDVAEGDDV
jgi:predicted amidohydrolase